MRPAKLLLLAASLLLLQQFGVANAAGDNKLMGWQDFNMKVTDKATSDAINDFVRKYKLRVVHESHQGFPVDVIVSPQHLEEFKKLLAEKSVEYTIPNPDVGKMLNKEREDNMQRSFSSRNDPSTFFAQTTEIYPWLRSLAAANPTVASVEKIGESYEKRDLLVLKLSTDPSAKKPIIFIDAAIHAREWLAPATLNFIIKSFLRDRNSGDAQSLLSKFDWYFMPVVNPDGYDFTFRSNSNRFWRKTRQPYRVFYYGADPNRNFDFQFGGPGTSNNPGSDIYHGPRPFSEPETKALGDYISSLKERVGKGMYISFHTYGQMWLTPPGYSRINGPDHAEMMRVANIGMNAIRDAGGPTFRVGQPANIGLYEAAGGSYDWVKYVAGVKYSYTLELRPAWPAGLNGFVAQLSDIPKSGAEIYAAVKAVANARAQV